jgi:hypothetical protein
MGEIECLVAVRREVDAAVVRDPALEATVRGLVPEATIDEPVGAVPAIADALGELARTPPAPERLYDRLLAVAALAWAEPEPFGCQGTRGRQMAAALRPLTRHGEARETEQLHRTIDEAAPGPGEDRTDLRRTVIGCAHAHGHLRDASFGGDANLIDRGQMTRARASSHADLPGFGLEDIALLFDPEHWGKLSDGRLTMVRVPDPSPPDPPLDRPHDFYQETFEVPWFWLTPLIEVVQWPPPTDPRDKPTPMDRLDKSVRWLEYRLSAAGQSEGEQVLVDQGSIVGREVPGGLRITTTKRVRFTPPFDAPSLALVAEDIGYFDAFEDMVRAAVGRACPHHAGRGEERA